MCIRQHLDALIQHITHPKLLTKTNGAARWVIRIIPHPGIVHTVCPDPVRFLPCDISIMSHQAAPSTGSGHGAWETFSQWEKWSPGCIQERCHTVPA